MSDVQIAIWKYKLNPTGEQVFDIPMPAEIVGVGVDPTGALCLWAFARTDGKDLVKRVIHVIGTGNPMPKDWYIRLTKCKKHGTVKQGPFMWHIFEERD